MAALPKLPMLSSSTSRNSSVATFFIHNMVLSHADNDHATGLIGVLERFEVKALWMNRPWLYAPQIIDKFHGNWTIPGLVKYIQDKHAYLVQLEEIAAKKRSEE